MKLPLVNLGDVLKLADIFVDGDWVESKDQDVNGDVRLIQLADIGDGYYINKSSRFLTSHKARELRCTFLEKGDILLARMPEPLGRACIFPSDPKKSVTVVDVCIIRLKRETHDARWLMYCLNSPICRNQMADFATGTTRTRISRGNLAKIKIPLSPLDEQKRIAEILDRTQSLISKRKEAIAKLDTLTQSIFLEMFGDPVANEKGWERKPFGEVVVNKDSKRKPVKEEDRSKQKKIYPYYGAIGIIDYVDSFLFDETNLLIEEDGMNLLTRNKPIAFIARGKYWVNNHAHVVSTKEELDLIYICNYLNFLDIDNFVTGIDQKKLNRNNLDKIPVSITPLPLQKEFAQRVEAVEKLKATHRASLSQLEDLFASLQHRAFRGEL